MPRIVESKTCPTCGHDKGTVQRFEIPEIPVLDTASLDPIKKKLDEITTPPLSEDDACKKYGLCKVGERDTAVKELDTIKHSHPELTEEFLTGQESCPNCAPHLKAYVEKKIKEQGLIKPVTEIPDPNKEKPEDVPVWRR